jgi:hypothetical protein
VKPRNLLSQILKAVLNLEIPEYSLRSRREPPENRRIESICCSRCSISHESSTEFPTDHHANSINVWTFIKAFSHGVPGVLLYRANHRRTLGRVSCDLGRSARGLHLQRTWRGIRQFWLGIWPFCGNSKQSWGSEGLDFCRIVEL